jgi:hypothetical protein
MQINSLSPLASMLIVIRRHEAPSATMPAWLAMCSAAHPEWDEAQAKQAYFVASNELEGL